MRPLSNLTEYLSVRDMPQSRQYIGISHVKSCCHLTMLYQTQLSSVWQSGIFISLKYMLYMNERF